MCACDWLRLTTAQYSSVILYLFTDLHTAVCNELWLRRAARHAVLGASRKVRTVATMILQTQSYSIQLHPLTQTYEYSTR